MLTVSSVELQWANSQSMDNAAHPWSPDITSGCWMSISWYRWTVLTFKHQLKSHDVFGYVALSQM